MEFMLERPPLPIVQPMSPMESLGFEMMFNDYVEKLREKTPPPYDLEISHNQMNRYLSFYFGSMGYPVSSMEFIPDKQMIVHFAIPMDDSALKGKRGWFILADIIYTFELNNYRKYTSSKDLMDLLYIDADPNLFPFASVVVKIELVYHYKYDGKPTSFTFYALWKYFDQMHYKFQQDLYLFQKICETCIVEDAIAALESITIEKNKIVIKPIRGTRTEEATTTTMKKEGHDEHIQLKNPSTIFDFNSTTWNTMQKETLVVNVKG